MRVENKFEVNSKYLMSEDIPVGECFRYVGDDKIYFRTCDGCYNLEDGDDYYSYNDNALVEKVIGHFVVDEIIHNVDKE